MGVLGLDALVHARQMGRQCLALGLAAWLLVGCTGAWGGVLQSLELGLKARLVGGQRLLEDVALLGVHGFSFGAELPGLQPGQLERDALDLRVPPLDGLGLGVDALALLADVLALLSDVGEQLRGDCAQFTRAQRLEVLGFDRLHIEHAALLNARWQYDHRGLFQLH